MKRCLWIWQLWGFGVVSLGGTLLHFLYEWLGEAVWIAPFSGVNESTWEHMKLLFWPMLLFAIVQYLFSRSIDGFWRIKAKGIFLGLFLIPFLYYGYNGVIGKSPDFINIAIFFIAAAIAFLYETRLFYKNEGHIYREKWAILALCITAILFIVFTFVTPKLAIFKDPLTGGYGI